MKNKFISITIYSLLFLFTACNIGGPNEQSVNKISKAPVIDGKIDKIWEKCAWIPIKNIKSSKVAKVYKSDISGKYKVVWDNENCYFFFSIVDDVKFSRNFTSGLEEKYDLRLRDADGVELFFDLKNGKTDNITNLKEFNFKRFSYNIDSISSFKSTPETAVIKGIDFKQTETPKDYCFEIKIPWKNLNTVPVTNLKIGFEVNVVDNDNYVDMPGLLSKRKSTLSWNDRSHGNPYASAEIYGVLVLKDN